MDPAKLVGRVARAIRDAYQRHGILAEAQREPARRFGATLTLAAEGDGFWRFVLIGDSGLRLNGSELWRNDTGLDRATASLRQEAYRLVASKGGTPDDQARIGRACAFHGAARVHSDMRPWLDDALLSELRAACLASCRRQFPAVPLGDIERLIDGGILAGQGDFQNNTVSPLSYAVLDGFETPMALVRVIDRERSTVGSIELFTDGYFAVAETPSAAAWEASFREIERSDPDKIDPLPKPQRQHGQRICRRSHGDRHSSAIEMRWPNTVTVGTGLFPEPPLLREAHSIRSAPIKMADLPFGAMDGECADRLSPGKNNARHHSADRAACKWRGSNSGRIAECRRRRVRQAARRHRCPAPVQFPLRARCALEHLPLVPIRIRLLLDAQRTRRRRVRNQALPGTPWPIDRSHAWPPVLRA